MQNKKVIGWFSCGVTSAVACKLAVDQYGKDNVVLIYIEIDSAHADNERFILQCENWIGVKIERRRSSKYKDQFDVIEKTRYINGPAGARCTKELKKDVRRKVEEEFDFKSQVFGFEFEKKEINRAIRFSEQYPSCKPVYPLIEKQLNKKQCAGILLKSGIDLPEMYQLGFHNNNCIGCVKGGMSYWNLIRKHFPKKFEQMSSIERKVGRSCINGKFLDELKEGEGRHEKAILPDCGTFCEIEFAEIISKKTESIILGELDIIDTYEKELLAEPVIERKVILLGRRQRKPTCKDRITSKPCLKTQSLRIKSLKVTPAILNSPIFSKLTCKTSNIDSS